MAEPIIRNNNQKAAQSYLMAYLPYILNYFLTQQNSKKYVNLRNGYTNFLTFSDSNDALKVGDSKLIGKLARGEQFKQLNKLPPNVISCLTPYLKIYKLIYNEGENKEPIYFEVPFDNFTNQQEFLGVDSILTNYKGTIKNAGIKSFDYNFVGVNPAESERAISAKLVLMFDSIDKLLQEIEVKDATGKPVSVQYTSGKETKTENLVFKYSDLVNQSARKIGQEKASNPKYYRIKIELGYAFDSTFSNQVDQTFDLDTINNILQDSKICLSLYPWSHELNFSEDGMIELSISYQASIESVFSDELLDLFNIDIQNMKYVVQLRKSIEALEESKKQAIRDSQCDRIKQLEESFDKLIEDAKKEKAQNLSGLYQGVIKTLFERGNIYSLKMPLEYLNFYNNNNNLLNNLPNGDNVNTLQPSGDVKIFESLNGESFLNSFKNASEQGAKADPASMIKFVQEYSNSDPSKTETVDFIFFGDLLDAALSILAFTEDTEKPLVIVGNVSIPHSSNLLNNMQQAAAKFIPGDSDLNSKIKSLPFAPTVVDGEILTSLANFPISMDILNVFLTEKIIKTQRETYPLKLFLRDVLELLVQSSRQVFNDGIGSIGVFRPKNVYFTALPESIVKTIPDGDSKIFSNTTAQIGAIPWQIPGVKESAIDFSKRSPNTPMLNLTNTSGLSGLYTKGLITNLERTVTHPKGIEFLKNSQNVLFISTTSKAPSTLNVKSTEKEILNSGVSSIFNMGSNVGILKSVKFKKTDIPFLLESRAFKEGELNKGVLRMKYDADITIFGNSLFRPGDFIKINPVFLSSRDNEVAASLLIEELGLGGYYEVIKTSTKISSGVFETDMHCVFQYYNDGTKGGKEQKTGTKECPDKQ